MTRGRPGRGIGAPATAVRTRTAAAAARAIGVCSATMSGTDRSARSSVAEDLGAAPALRCGAHPAADVEWADGTVGWCGAAPGGGSSGCGGSRCGVGSGAEWANDVGQPRPLARPEAACVSGRVSGPVSSAVTGQPSPVVRACTLQSFLSPARTLTTTVGSASAPTPSGVADQAAAPRWRSAPCASATSASARAPLRASSSPPGRAAAGTSRPAGPAGRPPGR